jgi:23S rRNA (cytidine2498-2'-O)-methyltransferase
MPEKPKFVFVTCQVGAEDALKAEIGKVWPDFRFSFSRPGFLTFKLPPEHRLVADFDLRSTFAQSHGFSLGRTQADSEGKRGSDVWEIWGSRPVRAIHVWSRTGDEPAGESADMPSNPTTQNAREAILAACPDPKTIEHLRSGSEPAQKGDFVLDCVLVEPDQWWIGLHRAKGPCSRFPGGFLDVQPSEPPVSRAWYKIEEALAWSELPVPESSRWADLGCAPGGISQALLERGHSVLGIDPAVVDPRVLEHPNFRHLRQRTSKVKRREFRKIRWLAADMNVAPKYTLEAVESIVMHPEVQIRGMMLTLKLLNWQMAEEIEDCVRVVKGWGFNQVQTRQLPHNRPEVSLAALKKPFRRGEQGQVNG